MTTGDKRSRYSQAKKSFYAARDGLDTSNKILGFYDRLRLNPNSPPK